MRWASAEAEQYAEVIERAIAAAGGIELVRSAASRLEARQEIADHILEPTGLWELDIRADSAQREAAALASRAAGAFALPYPVAERLAAEEGFEATFLVPMGERKLASHVDLGLRASAVDLLGYRYAIRGARGGAGGRELGPFATELQVERTGDRREESAALVVLLQSWWLLGLLERAVTVTVRYAREREQFGQRIADFQGVAFRLADLSVAVRSLEQLAIFTTRSLDAISSAEHTLADAVALRAAAQEAADTVLHGAHQIHGAMGFTDETTLSWLSRASHSVRRLPEGRSQTSNLLVKLVMEEVHRKQGQKQ